MPLKQITKLTLICVVLMLAWQGQTGAQTYFGDSVGDPLPDVGTSGDFESVASVPVSGTIGVDATIDEVTVDLFHTFDGDLDIELVAPSGASIFLSDQNGGAGDDYLGTAFVDGFPPIDVAGSPPFSGTFGPEGGGLMNTAFAGECIMGDWKLSITDNFAGDSGTFLGFSITFTTSGAPCVGPPPCTVNSYTGDAVGDPIDSALPPTESTFTVGDAGTIGVNATIESVELDLTHTFDGDLEITLIAPGGAPSLILSDNNGGAGDDYTGTVFMDGNPAIGAVGSPPFTGTFGPDGGAFATAFAGVGITGDWTLRIEDIFAGDVGTFLGATLNICIDDTGPICTVPGYTLSEIGCSGGPSDYCYDALSDTWTVSSETCYNPAFYRSTDDEAFVHTEICSDAEIVAEVTGVTGSGWGGIGMREDVSEDSKMLQLMIDGVSLTRRELRSSSPGTAFAHMFQTAGRNWLRLTRTGSTFGAYHSTDGSSWQPVLITQISMSSCIEVGLLTQNKTPSGEVEATFENVSITTPSPLVAPGVEVEADIASQEGLTVYPNPATTEANLKLNDFLGEAIQIEVYNSLGQAVYFREIDEVAFSVETFDISNYESGLYLIKVKTETEEFVDKLVVKHK